MRDGADAKLEDKMASKFIKFCDVFRHSSEVYRTLVKFLATFDAKYPNVRSVLRWNMEDFHWKYSVTNSQITSSARIALFSPLDVEIK